MFIATTQLGSSLTATADGWNVNLHAYTDQSVHDRTYVMDVRNAQDLRSALDIAIRDAELASR